MRLLVVLSSLSEPVAVVDMLAAAVDIVVAVVASSFGREMG